MRGHIQTVALTLLAAANLASAGAGELPVIPYGELRFVHAVSFSLLHTSLDGEADVPAGGVKVTLTCVIRAGKLTDCVPDAQANDSQHNFVSVALKRVKAMEVEPMTWKSEPTEGRRTLVSLTIKPTDRLTGSRVDFSKGDLISYAYKPSPQQIQHFYPSRGLQYGSEAVLDLACTVTQTYSLACEDVQVSIYGSPDGSDDAELKADFAESARKIMALYVVSPHLSSGQSSVGAGVRHRMRFVLA